MNNRPQGGSADLSDKANIEIMQHRRTATIDKTLDVDMALNETESKDGPGLKINAEYQMQIFNFNSGKSIQREQQIKNDQPMEYFFSFDKFDYGKAEAEPTKKECKEVEKKAEVPRENKEGEKPKDSNAGEAVKDANIIHKVVVPAPTYIKEVSADKGVANPAPAPVKKEEAAKPEEKVEKKENAESAGTSVDVVVEKKEEKTTSPVEETKTVQA